MIKFILIIILIAVIISVIWDAYTISLKRKKQRKLKKKSPLAEKISVNEAAKQIKMKRAMNTEWNLYMDLMYLNTRIENTKKGKWTTK